MLKILFPEFLTQNFIVKTCIQDYRTLFSQAFISEMHDFINFIQEKRQPESATIYDGSKVTEIANLATESFTSGKSIRIKR